MNNVSYSSSVMSVNNSVLAAKIFEYLPYVILTVSTSLIGTFGNLLIIAAIILSKELHTFTCVIILNLAVADLMVSSTSGTFTLISAFSGKQIFIIYPSLCKLCASACFIFCTVSFATMSLLAFNRYILICQNLNYDRIFSRKKTFIYCIITWLIGTLLDLPYLLSIDGQIFERTTLSCVFNTRKHKLYTNIIILVILITIGFLLPIFYLKIFKSIISSRSQTFGTKFYQKSEQKFLLKTTKGLFYSFLFFAFAFFPYFSLVLIKDNQSVIPRFVYLYLFMLARANSVFNPLLYATTNSMFKRGFKRLFSHIGFCSKSTNNSYYKNMSKTNNINNNKTSQIKLSNSS